MKTTFTAMTSFTLLIATTITTRIPPTTAWLFKTQHKPFLLSSSPSFLSRRLQHHIHTRTFAAASSTPHQTNLPEIHLIASDIDGTLLDPHHRISPRTVDTIRALQRKGILFVPATGKSRGGVRNALGDLGKELTSPTHIDIERDTQPPPTLPSKKSSLNLPVGGVYLQGLIVYKGMDVIFERTLDTDITLAVLRFARERQISFIAFNGDRILCEKMDATIAGVTAQHEPMPEVADLENLLQPNTDTLTHTPTTIHKVILLGTPQQITAIRPDLQKFVGDNATLTQAQTDMVEVLPKGASKGEGVKKLLEALNIHTHNVLAIGDQENDIEMLKLVNVSVAMGNAPEHVKKEAKYETEGNEVEGAAKAFERFCGV